MSPEPLAGVAAGLPAGPHHDRHHIIFLTYPTVTNPLLGTFSCPLLDEVPSSGTPYSDKLHSVGRYWSKDYDVRCYEGSNRLLMLLLGVPGVLLFSVGVPAFSAWFLWYNQNKLRWRNFFRAYGFLYSDYEDRCFAWESVIMMRKLVMVAVVVFLGAISTEVQLLVSLGVILVALAAQIWYNPYRCPRMDALERVSLYSTTVLIYISLFFLLELGDVVGLVLTVVLLALNGIVMLWFVLVLLREIARLIMRGMDTGEDGVVTAADVMNRLEVMSLKRPWLAHRILAADRWARSHPRVARFLSYAYPYGEPTDPWIVSHFGLQPDADLQPDECNDLNDVDEPSLRRKDRDDDSEDGSSASQQQQQSALDTALGTTVLEPQLRITVVESARLGPPASLKSPAAAPAPIRLSAGALSPAVTAAVAAISPSRSSSYTRPLDAQASVSAINLLPRSVASPGPDSRRASVNSPASPLAAAATRNAPALMPAEPPTLSPGSGGCGGAGYSLGGSGAEGDEGYSPSLPGMTQTGLQPIGRPSFAAWPPTTALPASAAAAPVTSGAGVAAMTRPTSGSMTDSGRLLRLDPRASRVFPQPQAPGSRPGSPGATSVAGAIAADGSAGRQLLPPHPPTPPRPISAAARDSSEAQGTAAAGSGGGGASGLGSSNPMGSRPNSALSNSGTASGRRSMSAWEARPPPPAPEDGGGAGSF